MAMCVFLETGVHSEKDELFLLYWPFKFFALAWVFLLNSPPFPYPETQLSHLGKYWSCIRCCFSTCKASQ